MSRPQKDALQRFVPRIAADWDRVAAGNKWQEIDGTLCMLDLSGFTSLSERLARRGRIGAEELTDVLNRVFAEMLQTGYDFGGSLLKFGGDALLLLFTGTDHAIRAVSATVAMRTALRSSTSEPTSVGRIRLRMSVGVHSGPIHVFCVGDSHRELVITGHAGTLTTSMEHTADAGEILVSSATRKLLPDRAVSGPKGDGWLLRWRKPAVEPGRFSGRDRIRAGAMDRWMPTVLRSYLTATTPESEHRIATVGFIRFCGVDQVLDAEGPAAVADRLDRMVSIIQDAADAENVTFLASDINEDGGKIVLVAGAPTVREDDEGHMLRAMRRIADAEAPFDLHIGIDRGHVFAGEVGAPYRSTYTVMGDTVNTAARLCAAAWAGTIYATPAVLERSHTLFATEQLEPLTAKGKAEPLVVYSIGEELGFRGEATRTDIPFVGRTAELEQLATVLGDAGPDQIITIIGDTGIGKSRLVDESIARHSAGQVIEIRAEPYGSSNPYRPLRDPLRTLLDIDLADQASMAGTLRRAVERIAPDMVPLLPLLGDAMHIDVPSTVQVDEIEPRFRRDRLADLVVELMNRVATDGLVLIVEDGHWMDEASTHLLGALASSAARHPWRMIVTRRPGSEGFAPDLGATIELEPFSPADSAALVNAATAAAPLRPHEVQAIVDRAGGNPLFVEEMTRAIRDSGGTGLLPESLGAVVGARIDALPPLARLVLRYASVLGQSFRIDNLRRLLGEESITLDAATRRELSGFLGNDSGGRLVFRHAIVRDVAYEGLSFRRRRQLHLRAATATEAQAGAHIDDVADLLAMHYSLGADFEGAWKFARIAGDRAKDAFANVESAAHYERALEAARRLGVVPPHERAAVWVDLGDVREPIGLFDEALDAYRRASQLLRDQPQARANVQFKRASVRDRTGDYALAMRETTLGMRLLEAVDTREAAKLRARFMMRRASIRQAQERPQEALRLATTAYEAARAADEVPAEAAACQILHWAHLVLGRDGGTAYGERALQLFDSLGGLGQVARVTNNLGAEAFFAGRWDDAVRYYRQGQTAAQRAGDVLSAAMIGSNIGEVLVNQGHLDDAEAILRDSARVQRASGWVEGADAAERNLGKLLVQRGAHQDGIELLERVYDDYATMGRRASAVETGMYLAQGHIALGHSKEAADLLSLLGPEASAAGHGTLEVLVRAEYLGAAGAPAEALETALDHLAATSRDAPSYERALLVGLAADAAALTGGELPADEVAWARRTFDTLGVQRTARRYGQSHVWGPEESPSPT